MVRIASLGLLVLVPSGRELRHDCAGRDRIIRTNLNERVRQDYAGRDSSLRGPPQQRQQEQNDHGRRG